MTEKTRMVTLHKHNNGEDIVWLIELDGVKTSTGITQVMMEHIRRDNIFDEAVDGIADSLAINSYPITDKEKERLNKLLQCMI